MIRILDRSLVRARLRASKLTDYKVVKEVRRPNGGWSLRLVKKS